MSEITRRDFLKILGVDATAIAAGTLLSRVEIDRLFGADIVEVTENEIRIRVKAPGGFQKGSFRSVKLKGVEGVRIIVGRPKGKTTTETQSFRFDKSKWTRARAVSWAKKHGFKG